MIEFLKQITPSMRYRVLMIQYTKVLRKVSIFRERKKEMEYVLRRIEIGFYEPEQELMSQFDSTFRKVVITGQGMCHV